MNSKEYLITHLVPAELPGENSLRKLLFYTTTREAMREKKFFWGTGNNAFSENEINTLVDAGKLIELPETKKLEEKKGLWLDYNGNVYYADLVSPNKDQGKMFLFAPEQLSRVNQIYQKIVQVDSVPQVDRFLQLEKP